MAAVSKAPDEALWQGAEKGFSPLYIHNHTPEEGSYMRSVYVEHPMQCIAFAM